MLAGLDRTKDVVVVPHVFHRAAGCVSFWVVSDFKSIGVVIEKTAAVESQHMVLAALLSIWRRKGVPAHLVGIVREGQIIGHEFSIQGFVPAAPEPPQRLEVLR